ncbi:hypothetical protein ACSBPH_15415 [Microbacterium sp. F51-2R]|uniref:hypothetical protein n=1 Tax=Microbacterium sp. F51-2R TaxID=3445777 RepID=UPI003F9F3F02
MPTATPTPPRAMSREGGPGRTSRQVRALRGVVAATVTTLVAATSHTLAGGGPPSPALVGAVILLASPLAVALAGRRLAVWRLSVTVLVSQLLFHTSFGITLGATGGAAPDHAHHVIDPSWLAAGTTPAVWPPDPLMIGGHVVGALVTVLALHRGERMLRTLAQGILRLVRPAVGIPGPAQRRTLAPVATVVDSLRSSLLPSDQPRRGPPRAALGR